jgi:hypothetical protein
MKSRARLSAGAAALGALCLVLAPLARPASATAPLEIYDGRGIGQGIVMTFAVRPSIFDPLVQVGADYVETKFSSQGGGIGDALSAPGFPGKFAVGALTGAVGCGGLKGWVEARYPPTEKPTCKTTSDDSFVRTDPILDRLETGIGVMHAEAGPDNGLGTINSGGVSLRSDAKTPIVEVGEMLVRSGGLRAGATVEHLTQVTANDVRLLDGVITIGSIISTARTSSDGVTGTADGTVTFADVFADVGGDKHRATIDEHGIHISDPKLDRDQNLGLQEQLDDALFNAGISISASSPEETIDGAQSNATVGGLVMSFQVAIPAVPVPDEAAPAYGQVVDQIPTKCVRELTHDERPHVDPQIDKPIDDGVPKVPLCFNAGALIPVGGSEPALQLTVASAQAYTVGAPGITFTPPSFTPPPIVDGHAIPPSYTVGGPDQPLPQAGVPSTGPLASAPATTPVGLIARLPAIALAWAGAVLLVLAVGTALGPSLRHAGSQ